MNHKCRGVYCGSLFMYSLEQLFFHLWLYFIGCWLAATTSVYVTLVRQVLIAAINSLYHPVIFLHAKYKKAVGKKRHSYIFKAQNDVFK